MSIISSDQLHLDGAEDLSPRIVAQHANKRVQQVGAAIFLSVVGASALILIEGASKRQDAHAIRVSLAKIVADPVQGMRQQSAAPKASRLPIHMEPARQPAILKTPQFPISTQPAEQLAVPKAEPLPISTEPAEPVAGARAVRTQLITRVGAPDTKAQPKTKDEIASAAAAIAWQDPPDSVQAATASEPEEATRGISLQKVAARGVSVPAGLPACLPVGLQNVIAALEARFHGITVVSTTHLNTDNHDRGSVREKLHLACKAVDVKTSGSAQQVAAFLHTRPEVAGVSAYRNHVVHFDLSAKYAKTTDHVASAGGGHGSR